MPGPGKQTTKAFETLFIRRDKNGNILKHTVRWKRKWTLFEVSYIFEKWPDFDEIFGGDPDRLQVFFAHIFKSIGPVLRKLRAKMHFFTFSKMSKNTYMTRKIHPPNYWHYGFSSYFGFGSKQSIAIFSAIQNVIWSQIDDFRTFWKLCDFPLLTWFFTWFFAVFVSL